MAHRIDVKYAITDPRGKQKLAEFSKLGLSGKLETVMVVDSYLVDANLNAKQLLKAKQVLINPLLEVVMEGLPKVNFSFLVEVGFLPGVTDNVGQTAKETIADALKIKFKDGQNIYTSRVYFLSGKITIKDAEKIAQSQYNPLIQKAVVKTFVQVSKEGGLSSLVPKVKLSTFTSVSKVDLNISDNELVVLGKQGIADKDGSRRGPLALDLDYLKAIQKYFNDLKRKPTDIEIETLAQTWSEHCKHTIFASPIDDIAKGLYKTYIKGATEKIRASKGKKDFCVSVFTDNSGAIEFDNEYLITHKVETHNSPSALDPFGGAITGIVGVNRDCIGFGLGAKPVMNTYGFCLAEPKSETEIFRDKELTQSMLSSQRIMEGVVAGVNSGGNCSGIPTPQGFVFFDERFKGKPLVFAGTVGLIPKKIKNRLSHEKFAKPSDYIVTVGGKVGMDGIHGATFSSESLSSGSPATAVQIGDPITQKKLSDAIVKEARDKLLYSSITDCGAGGLSSAVAEMAKETGGCEVNLDKVPLKYPGLAAWQIWISESQERMVLAVPKKNWKELSALLKQRGVEATIIGKFTNSGKCVVKYKGDKVVNLDLEFLHNGLPTKHLKTKKININTLPAAGFSEPSNLSTEVKKILERPNIKSFAFISRQYDHEVQGGSVLKPLQGRGNINGQASVTKPVLNSKKAVILSYGYNPHLSELDSYKMAGVSIDSAIRSAVAAGGNIEKIALLDNFCWCSSKDAERLYQLKEAARGCFDFATAYGTPFISGKDSMFNDFSGFDVKGKPVKISIPPTLLISAIGVINDSAKVISEDAKFSGDLIYILGETFEELAGSEYFLSNSILNGRVPQVNAEKNLKLYKKYYKAVQNDLVASAISLGFGGLAAAISKMSIAGQLGAEISLGYLPGEVMRDDFSLFSESQGRILVTVNPKLQTKFENAMQGTKFACIGKVTAKKKVVVKNRTGKEIISLPIVQAEKVYHSLSI